MGLHTWVAKPSFKLKKLRFIPREWQRSLLRRWQSRSLKYLSLFFVALFIALWLSSSPSAAIEPSPAPKLSTPQPLQEIRGVWMTNNDTDILKDRPTLQNAVSQ